MSNLPAASTARGASLNRADSPASPKRPGRSAAVGDGPATAANAVTRHVMLSSAVRGGDSALPTRRRTGSAKSRRSKSAASSRRSASTVRSRYSASRASSRRSKSGGGIPSVCTVCGRQGRVTILQSGLGFCEACYEASDAFRPLCRMCGMLARPKNAPDGFHYCRACFNARSVSFRRARGDMHPLGRPRCVRCNHAAREKPSMGYFYCRPCALAEAGQHSAFRDPRATVDGASTQAVGGAAVAPAVQAAVVGDCRRYSDDAARYVHDPYSRMLPPPLAPSTPQLGSGKSGNFTNLAPGQHPPCACGRRTRGRPAADGRFYCGTCFVKGQTSPGKERKRRSRRVSASAGSRSRCKSPSPERAAISPAPTPAPSSPRPDASAESTRRRDTAASSQPRPLSGAVAARGALKQRASSTGPKLTKSALRNHQSRAKQASIAL